MNGATDIGRAFTFRCDDGTWDAEIDGADGMLNVGNFATEGGAVDALRRWCDQRGVILTWATFTIRKMDA